MREGIKIVREHGDLLTSSWNFPHEPLVYKVGVKTLPPRHGGPLALFADLQSAKDAEWQFEWGKGWAAHTGKLRYFRCTYRKSRCQYLRWYHNEVYGKSIPGARLASSITLIEEVF